MEKFDVFLAHNTEDKPQVKKIAQELKRRNLKPWLDEEQIRPGQIFQVEIQKAIQNSKTAVIFIGKKGLGRWQEKELPALYGQLVQAENNITTVIPVLLPGVDKIPQDLIFLAQHHWVSFTNGINDEEALYKLECGIKDQIAETKLLQLIQYFKRFRRDIRGRSAETPKQTQEPEKISQSTQDNGNQSQDRRQFLKWLGGGTVSLVISVLGRVIWLTQNPSLESKKGIDYTKLRRLLANKNWKEADDETYRVMIQAVNKKEGDLFTSDELLSFPCTDLYTIDRLWVKYSNGHFGFSIQKEIYLSVGGKVDGKYYEEAWRKFGDQVGWRGNSTWIYNCAQVIYNISAPKGHLPICLDKRRGDICQSGGNGRGIVSIFYNLRREDVILFSRIETCKL